EMQPDYLSKMKMGKCFMRINILSSRFLRTLAMATFGLLLLEILCLAINQRGTPARAIARQVSESPDVNHVISAFTTGEAELHAAFNHYGYKWDITIQSVKDGVVTGEFHRVTQVVLDNNGKLEEKVISFSRSTLTSIAITREDLENLSAQCQFTLETPNISKYKIAYAGKEQIDDADLYIFSVKPKRVSSKELL